MGEHRGSPLPFFIVQKPSEFVLQLRNLREIVSNRPHDVLQPRHPLCLFVGGDVLIECLIGFAMMGFQKRSCGEKGGDQVGRLDIGGRGHHKRSVGENDDRVRRPRRDHFLDFLPVGRTPVDQPSREGLGEGDLFGVDFPFFLDVSLDRLPLHRKAEPPPRLEAPLHRGDVFVAHLL